MISVTAAEGSDCVGLLSAVCLVGASPPAAGRSSLLPLPTHPLTSLLPFPSHSLPFPFPHPPSFAQPLASVPLMNVSTHAKTFVLVPEANLESALALLAPHFDVEREA